MSTVPTAVLFPGQGSQEPGMGRDVAEASKEAMELWKKAEQISGLPLRAVYWESDDAALMADTKHLQPALTVVNVTLWQALSGKLSPACAAGHSLGEYSALAAAGSLSPESALELVSLRGKLMADADPDGKGGMAAILKLNREAVNEIARPLRKPREKSSLWPTTTPRPSSSSAGPRRRWKRPFRSLRKRKAGRFPFRSAEPSTAR